MSVNVNLGTPVPVTVAPLPNREGAASVIAPGTTFQEGMWCISPDQEFVLILQTGNMVLYEVIGAPPPVRVGASFTGRTLWRTDAPASTNAYFVVQTDGNLVIYISPGQSIWSSGTFGIAPIGLYLQDDGNLVMYTLTPVWATNTPIAEEKKSEAAVQSA